FYFKNWHGTTEGESPVWRHCLSKLRGQSPQKTPEGTPLLDVGSLEYLYAQVKSLNSNIKQRNILTRIRISNVFKKFLAEFNTQTVGESNITCYDLKIKYLATLEGLTSRMGSELFNPISLRYYNQGQVQIKCQSLNLEASPDVQVLITGTTGISWRQKPAP
ncbi:hypothetical protein XENOCAPTIV_021064, partial [Xenoophorus captivus]